MSMCNFAPKGRLENDLYRVGRDVKPYSLTHSQRIKNIVLHKNWALVEKNTSNI